MPYVTACEMRDYAEVYAITEGNEDNYLEDSNLPFGFIHTERIPYNTNFNTDTIDYVSRWFPYDYEGAPYGELNGYSKLNEGHYYTGYPDKDAALRALLNYWRKQYNWEG